MKNVTVSTASKQDYVTPWEFIDAVNYRWPISFDLAASNENKRCSACFTEKDNALSPGLSWPNVANWLWLNPPFKNIAPWMNKCVMQSKDRGCKIVALTSADRSTNWYRNIVRGNALALLLLSRIKFEGQDHVFPKPLQLLIFDGVVSGEGEFDWKAAKTLI